MCAFLCEKEGGREREKLREKEIDRVMERATVPLVYSVMNGIDWINGFS